MISGYKKIFLLFFIIIFTIRAELPDGFVYLDQEIPSIQISSRYATSENFVGKPIDGYKKPVIIVTKEAAQALKKVQNEVAKDGWSLLVYDGYRPQQAVDHFVRWSNDHSDQAKKDDYYPRIDKANAFELGYISKKSGHSRGSTIDLTLIKKDKKVESINIREHMLLDGFTIHFLDDGSCDMGSSFDLFDKASHGKNSLIADEYKKSRDYLREKMEAHGFSPYSEEWWHFTLKNEPFPTTYFNFPVE